MQWEISHPLLLSEIGMIVVDLDENDGDLSEISLLARVNPIAVVDQLYFPLEDYDRPQSNTHGSLGKCCA